MFHVIFSSKNFILFPIFISSPKLKLISCYLHFLQLSFLFWTLLSIYISSTLHFCCFKYWLHFNSIKFQKPFTLQFFFCFLYFHNFIYQLTFMFLSVYENLYYQKLWNCFENYFYNYTQNQYFLIIRKLLWLQRLIIKMNTC